MLDKGGGVGPWFSSSAWRKAGRQKKTKKNLLHQIVVVATVGVGSKRNLAIIIIEFVVVLLLFRHSSLL